MTVVDDEVSRLWSLLSDLSVQLNANREHCESLKRQCEQLKQQAIHTGTGFTLRRYNTDITKEQFESELERFNATLVLENQSLQYENRQLSMLLKDYEGTLDTVMAKFRGFAASTQQHELESAKHYEHMLLDYTGSSAPSVLPASLPMAIASTSHSGTADALSFQVSMTHVSALIRKAIRSLQGEDSSDDEDEDSGAEIGSDDSDAASDAEQTAEAEGTSSAVYPTSPPFSQKGRENRARSVTSSIPASSGSGTTSQRAVRRKRKDSKMDLGEGGYLRLLGDGMDKAERALERDIELIRLEKENRELRELLRIASGSEITDNRIPSA